MASNCKGMVCLYLCLFTLSSGTTENLCDSGCKCDGGTANCMFANLKTVTGFFPKVVLNIQISNVKSKNFGPFEFTNSTETICVRHGEISTMSSNAFSGLHSVKLIEFLGASIQSITSDAFKDITSHASIRFIDCNVVNINPNAFHHLRGLKEIRIEHSLISAISSFGFTDIQTHIFNITDTEISNLHNFSFHSMYNLDILEFNALIVENVSSNVFQNMRNISRVKLINCNFKSLPCLVLTGLREATPGNHDTFQFTKSQVDCHCSVTPFIEYIKVNPNAVTDTVQCSRRSSIYNGSLQTVSMDEIKSKCSNSTCVLEHISSTSSEVVGPTFSGSVTISQNLFAIIGMLLFAWYF